MLNIVELENFRRRSPDVVGEVAITASSAHVFRQTQWLVIIVLRGASGVL